jgi:hypothetical protein
VLTTDEKFHPTRIENLLNINMKDKIVKSSNINSVIVVFIWVLSNNFNPRFKCTNIGKLELLIYIPQLYVM